MSTDAPRVLIADADPALRQQLFSALLDHDIFSDCVANTADALAKLDEEAYGLLVLDVTLPPDDVAIVIEQVARRPLGARPIVLILAANPEAARSLDTEIVQIVLRKPVNLPQLVDVVRSCTRGARLRGGGDGPRKNGDQPRS